MATTGMLALQGARLYYEVTGADHLPAVVMAHAGIADHTMWAGQVAEFQDRYRMITYDARGYGHSETTATVEFSNRADLLALLDHLQLERPILMGCSRGGQIVSEFALEFPDRISALILVCAGISRYPFPDDLTLPEEAALFEAMEEAEEVGDWERVAELDVRVWVDGVRRGGMGNAEVREHVRAMCLHNYTRGDNPGTVIPLDPPPGHRLPTLRIPTLVLVGEFDTSVARYSAEVLATTIPNARKVVIKEAAHVPNLEQPVVFNALMSDFLATL